MERSPRFLHVAGRRLEYRTVPGDPSLPVVVLLHEGLGCVALWRDFPERLNEATGHPVFLYSRFGYGASDSEPLPWPLDYMQHEGLVVLPKVLSAAGVQDCVLLGHSDGASIALANAGGSADARVRALVVMAPHVIAEPCGLASIRKLREDYAQGLRQRLSKYHGDNVDCAFRGWSESWTAPGFASWDLRPLLAGITVPVLQIQGDDDPYGTVAQLREIEAGVRGPWQTALLAHCRHAPQFEQPARTLELIRDFLAACAA